MMDLDCNYKDTQSNWVWLLRGEPTMNFDFNKTQDRRQLENIWRKGSRWWSKKPVSLPPWGSSTLARVQWSSLAYAPCFTNWNIYDNRWSSWHGSIRKSYILFRSTGNFEEKNKYALNSSNVICAVLKPNFETKNWHIPIVTLRCCVPVHAKDPNHTKVPTTSGETSFSDFSSGSLLWLYYQSMQLQSPDSPELPGSPGYTTQSKYSLAA